jgi:ribonuclease VapC
MIVVDTSAIVAILWKESEQDRVRASLASANGAAISMGNLLELQLVLGGVRSVVGWHAAEALLAEYQIAPRIFDERQLSLAREAAVRFGRGRHRAALNFGDCFAYALAKSEDIPLLCTGGDFALTDVAIA